MSNVYDAEEDDPLEVVFDDEDFGDEIEEVECPYCEGGQTASGAVCETCRGNGWLFE